MEREEAEEQVLQRPFAPVMVENELVVLQVLRQLLVPHQSRSRPLRRRRCRRFLLRLCSVFRSLNRHFPVAMPAHRHDRRRKTRSLVSGE